MDSFGKIKKYFVEELGLKPEMISPDTTLESLGLDSLDKVELMFTLENEFGIEIPERGITITTLKDVVDLVERLVQEQREEVKEMS